MELSLAALPPPPLQRAFHSDPEASKAGSLSAEHLGGMTAAPPPASAYRAPGEATPPPSGRALPSTALIGFFGCGGGRMPPPSGVAGFRRGGRRALPPSGAGLLSGGRGLGSGSGSGSSPGSGFLMEGGRSYQMASQPPPLRGDTGQICSGYFGCVFRAPRWLQLFLFYLVMNEKKTPKSI